LAINGPTFVPAAGNCNTTLVGEATAFAGPYYNGAIPASNLRDALLLGAAIELYNVQPALTSSGTVELLQFKTPLNKTYQCAGNALVPNTPRAQMANQPYYQIRSLSGPSINGQPAVRSVWVPSDPLGQSYKDFNDPFSLGGDINSSSLPNTWSMSDGFYVLVTGATASTSVLRVRISLVYQFHPLDVVSSIVSQESAGPGASTRMLQSQLLKAIPSVSFMSTDESRNLVQSIFSTPTLDIDSVFNTALGVPISARVNAASNGFSVSTGTMMQLRTSRPQIEEEKVEDNSILSVKEKRGISGSKIAKF